MRVNMDVARSLSFYTSSVVYNLFIPNTGDAFTATHVSNRTIPIQWDHFRALTSPFLSICDVFVLTEIIVPAEAMSSYSIPGYKLFSYTRTLRKGGGWPYLRKTCSRYQKYRFPFRQLKLLLCDCAHLRLHWLFWLCTGHLVAMFAYSYQNLTQHYHPRLFTRTFVCQAILPLIPLDPLCHRSPTISIYSLNGD